MARKRYLVLGEGAAGMTAAEVLRRYDAEAAVTIVSDDPNPAYFRAALTNYLLGELRDEQIWAVPPTFYNDFRIERLLARVTAVDARKHQVWLSSGGPPMVYDALFIGTGARARQPAFEGADLQGVGTLRTLQDVRWVMDQLAYGAVRHAVVIGGGPLALEWAHALRERGAAVTMLVRETRFLPGALDAVGSDLLLARIRRGGIDVRLGDEVVRAMPDAAMRLGGVQLRSGQALQCDLCAAGIGVVCNTEALQNSGITLGPRGGVVVDDRMRTSVPAAYAAGDVAEFDGKLDQKWEPARLQALVAASNMAGADQRYTPGAQYFATRLYDLDFASIGRIDVPAPGPGVPPTEEIAVAPRGGGRVSYRKLFVQQGRLVGALLLGERDERVRQRGRQYKRLVDGKVDISSVRGDLLDPAFDLPAWLATRSLTHKPQPTRAFAMPPEGMPKMPKNAQMRGTMALDVRDLRVPMAAAATGFAPFGAGARGAPGPGGPPHGGAGAISPQAASVAAGAAGGALAGVPVIDRAVDPMLSIGLRAPHAPLAPAAGGPQAWLEGAGQRWDLAPETVSIGRGPQNHVVLTDPAVSHRHAQVSRSGPHLYLRDVGSRAGTFVNGRQVTVPHGLSHGDRVRLGTTELVFACPTGPAPAGAYANEPSLPGTPAGSHAPPTPGAWPGAGHAPSGAPNIGPSGYAQAPIPNAWGAPGQPPAPYSATPGSAGAPGARRACLEVRAGPILGVGFALSGASVTIGRDPQSAVRLDDMSVSRRHAVLAAHDGHWFVSDLSSARGTWKNGERLPPGQEFPLREGDRIQVGETVLELVSRPA